MRASNIRGPCCILRAVKLPARHVEELNCMVKGCPIPILLGLSSHRTEQRTALPLSSHLPWGSSLARRASLKAYFSRVERTTGNTDEV